MLLFVLVWLASYRVTRVVVTDSLFEKQRHRFFMRYPPTAAYVKLSGRARISKWGELFNCPWCCGYWISGFVISFVSQCASLPLPLLWWFAISSAVGLTARNLDG